MPTHAQHPTRDPVAIKVGARIRRARVALGMTRAELASQVARSVTHVTNIENGYRACPPDLAVDIAHALKVTPTQFLRDSVAVG